MADGLNPYGFDWGPIQVTRAASRSGLGRAITIEPTEAEKERRRSWTSLQVWVSEAGRKFHVSRRTIVKVRYPRGHPFAGEEAHRVKDHKVLG